jgi:putative DNA methylase
VPASRFAWSKEPKKSKNGSGKDLGRAEAEKFVEKLCKYPGDPKVIAEAERHILEAHAERLSEEQGKKITVDEIVEGRAPRPKVLDMFAGGGAIPLEALRLGCEAYALDLNPVAHIIELCTLVYPQRYGKPDPMRRGMTGPKNAKGETTWGGLAEEVRYWGNQVLEQVRKEVGNLYPLIPDPSTKSRGIADGVQPSLMETGPDEKLIVPPGYLKPVAYLWTRTVKCKNASCSATVPLVKQTWLCKKKGRYIALKMVPTPGQKRVRFEIVESRTPSGLGFDAEAFSKAGNATCPFCSTVQDSTYVHEQGRQKAIGQQLMSVVCSASNGKGRKYLSAEFVAEMDPTRPAQIIENCRTEGVAPPQERIPPTGNAGAATGISFLYGMDVFCDIFSGRQLAVLLSFVRIVRHLKAEIGSKYDGPGRILGLLNYLALAISRLTNQNNTLCVYHSGRETVEGSLGRKRLIYSWDYPETNPLVKTSGSFENSVEWVASVASELSAIRNGAHVQRGSALRLPFPDAWADAVITDPPYYDNIGYSELSDLFYVWLKRLIGDLLPDHFAGELTPKKEEAVAAAYRQGGSEELARATYQRMMSRAFREAYRALKPAGVMVVIYAHKTTSGWATLIDSVRLTGFEVVEAWPIDTEMKTGLTKQNMAMIASSITIVCRKRRSQQVGAYENQVHSQLEQIVRERVDALWRMGITGADLVIAAIGGGLRAFTRFEKVEYSNGDEVPAEQFLAEVEGVVLETMLEKIFGLTRSGVSTVDGPSRFYVLWRYTYKGAELDAGEAIVFTYGQPVELDGQKGLSSGSRALLEKKKSKYRLYDFTERGENGRLGLPNEEGEPAPLIDVLHRVLWLIENRPRSLPAFLDEARPDRERLRLVAQALAGPGLKGSSDGDSKTLITTTTAEQAALGKLLANWRSLIDSRLEEFRLR